MADSLYLRAEEEQRRKARREQLLKERRMRQGLVDSNEEHGHMDLDNEEDDL